MSEEIRQKLASDSFQHYFDGERPISLKELQPLYEELGKLLHFAPAVVHHIIQQRLRSKVAAYSQVKAAISREFVLPPKAKDLTLEEAVQQFEKSHSESETAAFQSVLRDRLIFSGRRVSPVVSTAMYEDCVQQWESHKANTDPVVQKLRKTIEDYKEALANLDADSPQQAAIRDLVTTLEGQMKGLSSPADPVVMQKLQRRQFKSLQSIFSFYCKQQLNPGKVTFENIAESNSHWNLGKFLKFSIDFGVTGRSEKAERMLSREELKLIYQSCADTRKLMDFAHFVTALSQIADKKYDAQYDELHGTKVQGKSLADKQALLYIDLHLEDVPSLQKSMKSFAVAFTHEKEGFRLPEDDPAKRYKPLSPEQKAALKDWQKRKAIFSTGSASISSLRSSTDTYQEISSKIPSDAVALKRPPPDNYSEMYHLRHHPVSLTWQTLSSMHYTDINVAEDIAEVIGMNADDSGEDLLDKQYHLGKYFDPVAWKSISVSGVPKKSVSERRYDGLMRLADEKINRGLTSVRRMSTTMSALNQTNIPF